MGRIESCSTSNAFSVDMAGESKKSQLGQRRHIRVSSIDEHAAGPPLIDSLLDDHHKPWTQIFRNLTRSSGAQDAPSWYSPELLAIVLQTESRSLLDPDLNNLPQKRKASGANARFDRMVETMCVVNSGHGLNQSTTRRQKKRRGLSSNQMEDAYSPPLPVHLAHGLSFMKMDKPQPFPPPQDDDPASSDSVELVFERMYRVIKRFF